MSLSSDCDETEFIRTMRRTEIMRKLCDFMERYPNIGKSEEPPYFDDVFQDTLRSMCDSLSKMEFSYSSPPGSSINTVLAYADQILTHLTNTDISKPLSFIDYQLYLKLAAVIERLKHVLIVSECRLIKYPSVDKYLNTITEQHIIDTYRSKFEIFKANPKEEVELLNASFTNFLIEYVKLISKSVDKLSLEIEFLFEIADIELLLVKFHKISTFIPIPMKISILKRITKFCLKNNYSIQNNALLISDDDDFKVELLILSYYTLQHLCAFLEHQNLNQSIQLLSKISVDSMISALDLGLESINVENKFILQAYKSIKDVPSSEIENCLSMLRALFFSLRKYNLHSCNSQFKTVLLSLFFEFVLATNLDKSCITSLIDIHIDVISSRDLPVDFKAGSYALMIYQKLKSDCDLELKVKKLFEKMALQNMKPHCDVKSFIMNDLENLLCSGENWIDVSVVASRFLNGSIMDEEEMVNKLFYALNECVILTSQNAPINSVLIFPFTISLYHSLETKNDDCLFNNLAVLGEYVNFVMDKNQVISVDDRKSFMQVVLKYYKDIVNYLPNEFLIKCWELTISPSVMDLTMIKALLKIRSSTTFYKFIESLKIGTMKLFGNKEYPFKKDYYLFIVDVWNYLLNFNILTSNTKKIRKDLVNHFCFTLNRTFLFHRDKVPTDDGLMLLMKMISLLLQVPWINITTLMNCSMRIITFVEKDNSISNIDVLSDAAELLIVLYKCPNNSIEPHLGLYMITFANLLKRCCKFARDKKQFKKLNLDAPFHKLAKCSNLFKQNKGDFEFLSRYALESLIDIYTEKTNLPQYLMNYCHSIIHSLMAVCSDEELKFLALNARGPAVDVLGRTYRDYTLHVRFNGRI